MHAAHMRTGDAPPGTALTDGMTTLPANGFLLACRPAAGGVACDKSAGESGDPAKVCRHVVMWDESRGKVGDSDKFSFLLVYMGTLYTLHQHYVHTPNAKF